MTKYFFQKTKIPSNTPHISTHIYLQNRKQFQPISKFWRIEHSYTSNKQIKNVSKISALPCDPFNYDD